MNPPPRILPLEIVPSSPSSVECISPPSSSQSHSIARPTSDRPGTSAPPVSHPLHDPSPVGSPPSGLASRSASGPTRHQLRFILPLPSARQFSPNSPSTPRHAPASRSGRAPLPSDPSRRSDPCHPQKHSSRHPHAPSRGKQRQPPRIAKVSEVPPLPISEFPVNVCYLEPRCLGKTHVSRIGLLVFSGCRGVIGGGPEGFFS